MINLLPKQWQDKLREEKIFKEVVTLGIIAVAASLVLVLSLWLVLIFYSNDLKYAQIALAGKGQQMAIFNIESAEKEIIFDNSLVSKLDEFYKKQVKITDIFLKAAGSLPEGVTLSSFGYSSGSVSLEGFSPDRDSLVVFKANLEKQSGFKKVTFPPENWLTSKNINFTASFKYEP